MKPLGDKQLRVLKAMRHRPQGWWQGCSMVCAGISVRGVLDTLARRNLVSISDQFVVNRGTVPVYKLTTTGEQLVDSMEDAAHAQAN